MSGKPLSDYKLNILCSYAYSSGAEQFKSVKTVSPLFNFILDSGGFTNYWQKIRKAAYGKATRSPIELKKYIEYCLQLEDELYGYIAVDMPRNPELTLENLERMVKVGLSPMPVFAEGVDYKTLPELIEINDRLCVAGSVQSSDRYTIQ